MDEKCFYCGHDYFDHRAGGLCELCMPVGDSTGMSSACQCFAKPPALSPAEAEAVALRARVAELELLLDTVREHESARVRRELEKWARDEHGALVNLDPEFRNGAKAVLGDLRFTLVGEGFAARRP